MRQRGRTVVPGGGEETEQLPPSVVCCGVGLYMHPGADAKGATSGPWVWNPTDNASARWTAIVWACTMIACLGAVARVGFRPSVEPVGIVIETLCDIFMALDILVMFHTAIEDNGLPVTDLKAIRNNYKRSLLIPDIIAVLPLHFAAVSSPVWYAYLRLPKLLRLLRFGTYFENWEQSSRVPTLVRLIRIAHIVFMCTHFLTCVYWYIARQEGFGSTKWTPSIETSEAHIFTQYSSSLFFVANSMSVQGGNSETRAPSNGWEYGFTLVAMMVGVVLYTLIIGTVATLLANLNENKRQFRSKVNAINKYMSYRKIPDEIRSRVRAYFSYLWSRQQGYVDNDILKELPPHIQVDVCLHLYKELISKVQFFHECSPAFINLLVVKLQMEVYAPGDFIIRAGDIGMEMYFILTGEADVEVNGDVVGVMKKGAFFGEIALLSASPRTASIVAATHCDLLKLTKSDLEEALKLYPEQMEVIEAVARQRLQRTHGANAKEEQEKEKAAASADGGTVRKIPKLARSSMHKSAKSLTGAVHFKNRLKQASDEKQEEEGGDGSGDESGSRPPSRPTTTTGTRLNESRASSRGPPPRPATSWAAKSLSTPPPAKRLSHQDSSGTELQTLNRGESRLEGPIIGANLTSSEWFRRLQELAQEETRDHVRQLSKRQLMHAHRALSHIQTTILTYAMYGSRQEDTLTGSADPMGMEDGDALDQMMDEVDEVDLDIED